MVTSVNIGVYQRNVNNPIFQNLISYRGKTDRDLVCNYCYRGKTDRDLVCNYGFNMGH